MDEQQTSSWSVEADGLVYSEGEASVAESYAPEPESEPAPITSDNGNVSLNEDGEVEFRDEFFGDLGLDEPERPARYTEQELRQTPYEQWDESRLEGDVKDYIPIVREQMQRRQIEEQMAQRSQTPPMFTAPQQYTPKELADDAQKLACERLGLEDPDDFDEYESEHRAALSLAMQELSNRRTAEIAQYQRMSNDYQQLQNFNAQLVRQPDYMEFDRWFTGKLQEAKVTPAQVNAGLMEYARQSGGDFRSIQGVLSNWYQEFRAEQGRNRPAPRNRPPVLEGAGGTSYEGRRSVDMRKFSSMDMDGQAEALMRMGYA
ncbi:MAG: hypothetical protein IJS28_07340 [Synergistaceae bacterium]|nr:hypothetical protein [Synergistaceae bacterium]